MGIGQGCSAVVARASKEVPIIASLVSIPESPGWRLVAVWHRDVGSDGC